MCIHKLVQSISVWGENCSLKQLRVRSITNKNKTENACLLFLIFHLVLHTQCSGENENFSIKLGLGRLPAYSDVLELASPGLQEPILWIFCWLGVQWLNIWPYWEQLPHRNWQMSQITAFLFQESFQVSIYQNTTVFCVCVYRYIHTYTACVYNTCAHIHTQSTYKGIENWTNTS